MKVSAYPYGIGFVASSETTRNGELYKVDFGYSWNGDENIRYLYEYEFTFLGVAG